MSGLLCHSASDGNRSGEGAHNPSPSVLTTGASGPAAQTQHD